tara:strand:- start:860 stop:2113 length:1254 start_codon:yes stop_codon:yes gene_type:complete
MTTGDANLAPETGTDSVLAPVAPGDRIFNLDMLRGWAILGILAVNAMTFAWPVAVEFSQGARPFAMDMANVTGEWVTSVFFQDKFRTLFTLLFGVSIFLVGGERTNDERGRLLRRRLLWLGLFGLIHGLALWYGDILLHYAYCGLLMMLMRSWPARRLLWIGGGVTAVWSLMAVGGALLGPVVMAAMGPEFATKAAASGPLASPADIMATVDQVRGGYGAALMENLKAWVMVQGFSLFLIPASVPLMMIGLGLFKSGYLQGRAPVWVYVLMTLIGAANLAVLGYAEGMKVTGGTLPVAGLASAAAGSATLITLGYASLLILMSRFGLRALTGVLVPVGQMAFTNYLTQTLIMTSLFYMPWGPFWYGTMGPGALWAVVGAVWLAQLIWSPLWLSRFRMGPLEWLWRCLTYGRRVPLLR